MIEIKDKCEMCPNASKYNYCGCGHTKIKDAVACQIEKQLCSECVTKVAREVEKNYFAKEPRNDN